MIDAKAYTTSIRYGEFEDEYCYEARIKKLPTITEYADSYEEAYALAIDSIETTAELYAELGRAMPTPSIEKTDDYSGRVTLRMPKSLHGSLTRRAEDEDVSLNQLVVSALSAFHGFGSRFVDTQYEWKELDSVVDTKQTTATIHHLRNYMTQAAADW